MWSLRVLVSTGLQAVVVCKIMGRIHRILLEAMILIGFPTLVFFHPKNGRKGNFLWKNREFSLWSLRVLVSVGLQVAVVCKIMGRIHRMLLEAVILFGFSALVFFQPKNGRKGNVLWKNKEFSLWSLRVLPSAVLQAAVVCKIMGRIQLMLLEAMILIGFPTLLFFHAKNGRKWNFLWKKREFSLWSLRVLVSAGLQAAVVCKIMGRIARMLLEAMILIGFPTLMFFHPKNGRKGNFLWKNREFSLWSLRILVSVDLQAAVVCKIMGRIHRMLLEAMIFIGFPTRLFLMQKMAGKGIFYGKTGNFLCGPFVLLFQWAFRLLWCVK